MPALGEPTIDDIIDIAAEAFGVTVDDLTGDSKVKPLVDYRHVTIAVAKALTSCSYVTIGHAFFRHRDTIYSTCRRVAGSRYLTHLFTQLVLRVRGVQSGAMLSE